MTDQQDIHFKNPITGQLSIKEVADKPVESNPTIIHITGLSLEGLRFTSNLHFPEEEDLVFTITIESMAANLECTILSCEDNGDEYAYTVAVVASNLNYYRNLYMTLYPRMQVDVM